jgi:RNA polymerase sigma-70 factor (ECF subfamily)
MQRRGAVVSIAGIGKREPGSVRDAVPAHVDELYRFALRLARNGDRARDIVHDSVLRALKHESVVRDPQAWLFQIVYHTFISYRRKDERHGTPDEDAWCDEAEPESLVDPLPALITAEDVRKAVDNLPEAFRAVVWLSDAERVRLREIAEILDCPLGTVASRLARGRQEIRRLLSAYDPQGVKSP